MITDAYAAASAPDIWYSGLMQNLLPTFTYIFTSMLVVVNF